MIRNKTSTIILIALFVLVSEQYTIDGPWKLQIDSSYKNISSDQRVIFDFRKQVQDGKISSQVTVLACSAIIFDFYVQNSLATFTLLKVGASRRQCIKDEISELIARLQKVAFTSTVGNILMFLSPSGKILIKLSKIQVNTYSKNIAAAWQLFSLLNQNASLVVKANSTTLQFCQGKATVLYNIISEYVINFDIVSSKGCPQNDFLTSLHRTKYFRPYKDQLWFYNSNYQLIIKLNNIGSLPSQAPLMFQNLDRNISSPSINTTQPNKQNLNLLNQTVKLDANSNSKNVSQRVLKIPDLPVIPIVERPLSTLAVNASVPQSTTTSQTKLLPPKLPQLPSIATVPEIRSEIKVQIPEVKTDNSLKNDFNTDLKRQQLFRKWFLLGSPSVVLTLTQSSITIMDCGVWITMVGFKPILNGEAQIFNINPRNSVASCIGKNSLAQTSLANLKYLTIKTNEKNQKLLQFRNKDRKVIAEWTDIPKKA